MPHSHPKRAKAYFCKKYSRNILGSVFQVPTESAVLLRITKLQGGLPFSEYVSRICVSLFAGKRHCRGECEASCPMTALVLVGFRCTKFGLGVEILPHPHPIRGCYP